mgnify:FL=1
MLRESLGALVQVLADSGFLKEDDLMDLVRIGTANMLGSQEEQIFKPLGYLVKDMKAGEPVYSRDFQRKKYVETIS